MKYTLFCLLLLPFFGFSQTGTALKEPNSTEDSGEYFGGAVKSVYKQHKFPSFNNSINLVYNRGRWKVNSSISYGREKFFRENDVSTFFSDASFIGSGTTDYDFNSFVTFIDVQYQISKKTKINVSSMNDTYENILDTKTNIDIYNTSDVLDRYYIGSKKLVSNLKRNSLNALLRHDFNENEFLTIEADWLQRPWDYNQNTYGQDYDVNGAAVPNRNYTVYHDGRTDLNIYTLNGLYHVPTRLFDLTVGGKWIYIESDYIIRNFRKYDADYVKNLTLSPTCTYIENRQIVFSDFKKNFGKLDLQLGFKLENTFINGDVADVNSKKELDDNYIKLFPSANASYHFDDTNKLSFAFSQFYNRPLYRFINPSLGIYNAYETYLGNPFLKPSLTSNFNLVYAYKSQYDLGFSYSKTKDNFWSLPNYTTDHVVEHKVVSYMDLNTFQVAANGVIKYTNAVETNFQLQGFYKLNKSLVSGIEDLDVWGWYGTVSNQVYFSPEKNISANLSFWYRSKNINQEALISKQGALDFGMKFLLLQKAFIIEVNVTDILKSMNEYKVSTVDNVRQTFRNYQDPRAFRISATYKFGNRKLNYAERIAENATDHSR
ncbi:outer membrane beta-barrel family protein [Flavobacterium sp. ENC]|uniref:outer membrane beta-barrel family protein n=1 Tax=Flavobacterium sp. ENC TaxID=2897330 RepID=UPI001E62C4A3|nr:outer membrane beta-barrel family protein [Flavobacterium sp. ENC]MCD0465156.1 outer membrane beta-barrel family protein [Flavobacterium sp. ENC]